MTSVAEEKKDVKNNAPAMPDWYELLYSAIQEPGKLFQAHSCFHQYSLANRWLVASQLSERGLPLEPINTFKGWQNLDRQVRKGEKALALIMPVPVKAKKKVEEDGTAKSDSEEKREIVFKRFMLRNRWFSLAQTEGEVEYSPEAPADRDWNIEAAQDFLGISEVPFVFSSINDTSREAYAQGMTYAISELSTDPLLTRVREVARIVLGHTAEDPPKSVPTDFTLRQIEVEAVVYLVGATLAIPGLEGSRARMQAYLEDGGKNRIPEKCAHRAFAKADQIINAGYA